MKKYLSLREASIVACLPIFFVIASDAYLTQKTNRLMRNRRELYERIAFSTSSYYRPEIHANYLFDGNPRTAWWDELPNTNISHTGRLPIPAEIRDVEPNPDSLYLTLEAGLTHFPGKPPQKNPLRGIRIHSGNQESEESFPDHARPGRIHILFFRQKLIDMDREYRHPPPPEFWAMKTISLKDTPEPQFADLSFLPPVEESPYFHKNIYMLWMRIYIENYYPGKKYKNRVAISEIDFIKDHKDD